MADLDLETLEQVVRWCAEAGRQTTPAQVRAALGDLGWDELLSARALLADPPPARPLGPYALADLARGVPADVAADREQAQRYPQGPVEGAGAAAPAEAAPPEAPAKAARRRGKARLAVIVRKKAPPPPAAAPGRPLPLLDELLLPGGRIALERLVRTHGGRRRALLAALSTSHRRPDAQPLADLDLDRLLEHHDLRRVFDRRERDEVLHALRAAGGVLARASEALGFDPAGLAGAIARLGCGGEVEALRAGKRRDLAGRATLSERARLLVADAAKLEDLGLLESFEADLKARLPELTRALGRSSEPLVLALARSLALPPASVRELAARIGLELGSVSVAETAAGDRPQARYRPGREVGERRADRPDRLPRAGSAREGGPRTARGPRPGGAARGPRPGGAQAGARPPQGRPTGADRPRGAAPSRPAGPGVGPTTAPPTGGNRPWKPRTGPARPAGDRGGRAERSAPRPMAPRPAGPRGAGPATGAARPSAARPPGAGGRTPGARPSGPRGAGPRPAGPRSPGARPPRPAGPHSPGGRPSGPRRPRTP